MPNSTMPPIQTRQGCRQIGRRPNADTASEPKQRTGIEEQPYNVPLSPNADALMASPAGEGRLALLRAKNSPNLSPARSDPYCIQPQPQQERKLECSGYVRLWT